MSNTEQKILDFLHGGFVIHEDSGNDQFCPTRHPILKSREVSIKSLLKDYKPTEFLFTFRTLEAFEKEGIRVVAGEWGQEKSKEDIRREFYEDYLKRRR